MRLPAIGACSLLEPAAGTSSSTGQHTEDVHVDQQQQQQVEEAHPPPGQQHQDHVLIDELDLQALEAAWHDAGHIQWGPEEELAIDAAVWAEEWLALEACLEAATATAMEQAEHWWWEYHVEDDFIS